MRATLPTLVLFALATAACGGTDTASDGGQTAAASAQAPAAGNGAATAAVKPEDLPPVLVYKTATCGCCNGWVDHMRSAGFAVDARDTQELNAIKVDAGVTPALASCHTALVDGYVVEGHVPAEIVERLLAERPDIVGLSVPGMVEGSPGMEGPNPQPYQVVAFDRQGRTSVYAEIDPR